MEEWARAGRGGSEELKINYSRNDSVKLNKTFLIIFQLTTEKLLPRARGWNARYWNIEYCFQCWSDYNSNLNRFVLCVCAQSDFVSMRINEIKCLPIVTTKRATVNHHKHRRHHPHYLCTFGSSWISVLLPMNAHWFPERSHFSGFDIDKLEKPHLLFMTTNNNQIKSIFPFSSRKRATRDSNFIIGTSLIWWSACNSSSWTI